MLLDKLKYWLSYLFLFRQNCSNTIATHTHTYKKNTKQKNPTQNKKPKFNQTPKKPTPKPHHKPYQNKSQSFAVQSSGLRYAKVCISRCKCCSQSTAMYIKKILGEIACFIPFLCMKHNFFTSLLIFTSSTSCCSLYVQLA